MDTSEEYIEMCRAEVIQEQSPTIDDFTRRPISISRDGNWFYIQATGRIGYKSIWLPGQDDLQAMIGDGLRPLWDLVGYLTWVDPFDNDRCGFMNFSSMEQLWIAFVMHEKYGKHWDGSDWVVE